MTIEVKTITARPNETVEFKFNDNVVDFIVGVSQWNFAYGEKEDHHIRRVTLNPTSTKSANRVTTRLNASMYDDSGNNLDASASQLVVCCVATVSSPDPNLTLGSATGIKNNTESGPFEMTSTNIAIGEASLNGFAFEYKNDHHVQSISAAAGFTSRQYNAYITSSCDMHDRSGNTAQIAEINGCLVASSPQEKDLLAITVSNLETNGPVDVIFDEPLRDAAVLLKSFTMSFNKDHHVKRFGAGCASWTVVDKTVTLHGPAAFMKDNSGNSLKIGNVSMLILGLPSH